MIELLFDRTNPSSLIKPWNALENLLKKKNNKNSTLDGHISNTRTNLESRVRFYMATGSASYNLRLHCQRLAVLKGLIMSQKKFWICSFFVFLLEKSWNFQQIAIFYIWPKAMQCNASVLNNWIFFKKAKKQKTKNATLNGHISKARTKLQSKLRFPEKSFNFLQNSVIIAGLKGLKDWG